MKPIAAESNSSGTWHWSRQDKQLVTRCQHKSAYFQSVLSQLAEHFAVHCPEPCRLDNPRGGNQRRPGPVAAGRGQGAPNSGALRRPGPGRQKIAKAKLGKPRPRHVIEAMRRTHVGRPLPASTRAKMSASHRRRGTRPPWVGPAWEPWEDRLCRKLPVAEVAKRTGRAIGAVYTRRSILGVPDGRTKAQRRKAGR